MNYLQEKEQIAHVIGKHWFTFLPEVFSFLLLVIIPPILYFIALPMLMEIIFVTGKSFYLFTFIYLIWLLVCWMFFFLRWTDYYLDVWIISDKRLIGIEQRGMFSREVAGCYLSNIQDVTIDTKGFLYTLLRIGDIYVQTAGESREFILVGARNPELVKKIIFEAVGSAKVTTNSNI